jgi:uncharacterized protein (UPF0147 family)
MQQEIKMEDQRIQSILEVLGELEQDNTVPRNIKAKIGEVIKILKQDEELSIRINKALSELDEVSDDSNMQPYTRTQIWNVVSALEMI